MSADKSLLSHCAIFRASHSEDVSKKALGADQGDTLNYSLDPIYSYPSHAGPEQSQLRSDLKMLSALYQFTNSPSSRGPDADLQAGKDDSDSFRGMTTSEKMTRLLPFSFRTHSNSDPRTYIAAIAIHLSRDDRAHALSPSDLDSLETFLDRLLLVLTRILCLICEPPTASSNYEDLTSHLDSFLPTFEQLYLQGSLSRVLERPDPTKVLLYPPQETALLQRTVNTSIIRMKGALPPHTDLILLKASRLLFYQSSSIQTSASTSSLQSTSTSALLIGKESSAVMPIQSIPIYQFLKDHWHRESTRGMNSRQGQVTDQDPNLTLQTSEVTSSESGHAQDARKSTWGASISSKGWLFSPYTYLPSSFAPATVPTNNSDASVVATSDVQPAKSSTSTAEACIWTDKRIHVEGQSCLLQYTRVGTPGILDEAISDDDSMAIILSRFFVSRYLRLQI